MNRKNSSYVSVFINADDWDECFEVDRNRDRQMQTGRARNTKRRREKDEETENKRSDLGLIIRTINDPKSMLSPRSLHFPLIRSRSISSWFNMPGPL